MEAGNPGRCLQLEQVSRAEWTACRQHQESWQHRPQEVWDGGWEGKDLSTLGVVEEDEQDSQVPWDSREPGSQAQECTYMADGKYLP